MRSIFNWIFGNSDKDDRLPVDFTDIRQVDESEKQKPYRIQIKHDLVRDFFNWRILDNKTGYEPRSIRSLSAMNGTSYTKGGAIKAAKKRVKKLEAEEKNREQRWEDVDV